MVYDGDRNFGYVRLRVGNICENMRQLMNAGPTTKQAPRDGSMAFVRTPDSISIKLFQNGSTEAVEAWLTVSNIGVW